MLQSNGVANHSTAPDILVASDMSFSVWEVSAVFPPLATDEGIEFDFRVVGDGRSAMARYANNSNYRNDSLIRKESTSVPRQL